VDLAVARRQLAARPDHQRGVVGAAIVAGDPLGQPAADHHRAVFGRDRLQGLDDRPGVGVVDGLGHRELVAFAAAEEREALRQHDDPRAVVGGAGREGAAGREVAGEVVGRAHLHGGDGDRVGHGRW
jgi:hypothetical protein